MQYKNLCSYKCTLNATEYRFRYISVVTLALWGGFVPFILPIGIPIVPNYNQPVIELLLPKDFCIKSLLKVGNFYDTNSNKIVLTEAQINKLDSVMIKYRSGSLTVQEAIL